MRSDSEVAREMQEAFDKGVDADSWSHTLNVDSGRMRSDSEIARDLQNSLDREGMMDIVPASEDIRPSLTIHGTANAYKPIDIR
jgi:hypothetical protein